MTPQGMPDYDPAEYVGEPDELTRLAYAAVVYRDAFRNRPDMRDAVAARLGAAALTFGDAVAEGAFIVPEPEAVS